MKKHVGKGHRGLVHKFAEGGLVGDDYNTRLDDDDEKKFQSWKSKNAPNDSGADYDLRGAYKAGNSADPKTGHWDDTFKKPNHPTFSTFSKYAKDAPDKAGTWDGDKYVPPRGKQ